MFSVLCFLIGVLARHGVIYILETRVRSFSLGFVELGSFLSRESCCLYTWFIIISLSVQSWIIEIVLVLMSVLNQSREVFHLLAFWSLVRVWLEVHGFFFNLRQIASYLPISIIQYASSVQTALRLIIFLICNHVRWYHRLVFSILAKVQWNHLRHVTVSVFKDSVESTSNELLWCLNQTSVYLKWLNLEYGRLTCLRLWN